MRYPSPVKPLLLALLLTTTAFAQEIRIAAASDLSSALPEIVKQFEASSPCRAVVSYGSSGNFFQQLQNAAPFDVFLSADLEYPQNLQVAGLTVSNTLTPYASGKLVLWARHEAKLDLSQGLKVLATSAVHKVAIANPQHAPYGKAAVAALRSAGLYDQLSAKLVLGENVSQAAVFAQSGNAEAGLIPLSLALSPAMRSAGSYIELPTSSYPPIHQAAVVLKTSKNQPCATKLVLFLKSDKAQHTLQQFGFSTQ